MVKSGSPDFPFCLAWANHSWYAKTWDPNKPAKLLIEQKYLGSEDNEAHFYALLDAFNDPRYIKVNNKPIFVIFKPLHFLNVTDFISQWNILAIKNGFDGIYFVGQGIESEFSKILDLGFDAVNHEEVNGIHARQSVLMRFFKQCYRNIFNTPRCYDYLEAMKKMVVSADSEENVIPTLCPNFDHTPRSGTRGLVYTNSTPEAFKKHAKQIIDIVSNKHNQLVFLKSWNEWGEGNYMEPDLKYGKGYIKALREVLDSFK